MVSRVFPPVVRVAYRQVLRNWGEYVGVLSSTMLGATFSAAAMSISGAIDEFGLLIMFASVSAIIVSMVSIGQTVGQALEKNELDYRLLRSSGATNASLYRLILLQVGAISVAGSIVGSVLGYPLARVVVSIAQLIDYTGNTSLHVDMGIVNTLFPCVSMIVASLIVAWWGMRGLLAKPIMGNQGEYYSDLSSGKLNRAWFISVAVFVAGFCSATTCSIYNNRVGLTVSMFVSVVAFYLSYPVFYRLVSMPLLWVANRARVVGRIITRSVRRNGNHSVWVSAAYSVGCMLAAAASVISMSSAATQQDMLIGSYSADTVVQSSDRILDYKAYDALKDDSLVKGIAATRMIRTTDEITGDTIRTYWSTSNLFADTMSLNDYANEAFEKGEAVVGVDVADRLGYKVGDTITITTPDEEDRSYVIGYITDDPVAVGSIYVPGFEDHMSDVVHDDGVDKTLYITNIFIRNTNDDPDVKHYSSEYPDYLFRSMGDWIQTKTMATYINLFVFYMIASLVVIVSVLALTTNIGLIISKTRRELALLKAAGMSNKQLWLITTGQSFVTSVSGGFLGTLLGIGFGYCTVRINGYDPSLPWQQLVWLIIASAIFSVIASIPPTLLATKTIGIQDMDEE